VLIKVAFIVTNLTNFVMQNSTILRKQSSCNIDGSFTGLENCFENTYRFLHVIEIFNKDLKSPNLGFLDVFCTVSYRSYLISCFSRHLCVLL